MPQRRNYYFPVEAEIHYKGKYSAIKQVSCGNEHTLAVDEMGRLFSAGNNTKGQLGVLQRNAEDNQAYFCSDIFTNKEKKVKIAKASMNFSVVLTESGELYASGLSANGRLGISNRHNLGSKVLEFT